MTSDHSAKHPPRERLLQYGLGKLNPYEASDIESHIADCDECGATLTDLQDDTFVHLVRRSDSAKPVAANVDPRRRTSPLVETLDVASGAAGTTSQRLTSLPAELQQHPRYEILELIGHGGMGDVYKAQHRVMNRPVALKVIKPRLVSNEAAVRRFQREVQAAARLHHPNIVTAHDAEQAGDLHYLVMEFVDGESLDELIRQRGPLPVDEACEYIRQTAEGLQYAHTLGMVHRDIKPHNLMVTVGQASSLPGSKVKPTARAGKLEAYPTVKILDFGLANFANETAAEEVEEQHSDHHAPAGEVLHQLTQMGTMMGTPDYIAPEQAKDAHAADIRADIYSLGCTFYTLLAGRAPFGEGSALEKIKAHSQKNAPPLSNFRDDLPTGVEAILQKMMAKDPAERFQTPAEVAAALSAVVASFKLAKAEEKDRQAANASSRKRRPLVPTAVATLFLALLVAAATIFYIQTDYGVVRVEVNDPSLEVAFAGETIRMQDGEKPLTIRAGEHKLVVRRGKFEFETDSFQLRRGDRVAFKVTLMPGTVVVSKDGDRFSATPLPGKEEENYADGGKDSAPKPVRVFPHGKLISSLAWMPDGSLVWSAPDTASDGWKLYFHDTSADGGVQQVTVPSRGVSQVVASADGKWIATGSREDGKVLLWDAKRREVIKTFEAGGMVHSVSFSPDGESLAAASWDGSAKVWSVASHELLKELSGYGRVHRVLFSPDGRTLVVSETPSGQTDLWDTRTWTRRATCRHGYGVGQMAFSPDGTVLVTGGAGLKNSEPEKNSVKVWDARTGELLMRFDEMDNSVEAVAVSHDSRYLIAVGGNWGDDPRWGGEPHEAEPIRIWDMATRRLVAEFDGHDKWVRDVAFSPDGRLFATASEEVKVWNWGDLAFHDTARPGASVATSTIRIRFDVINGSAPILDINGPGYSATGFFQAYLSNVREVVERNPGLPVLIDSGDKVDLTNVKIAERFAELRRVAESTGADIRLAPRVLASGFPERRKLVDDSSEYFQRFEGMRLEDIVRKHVEQYGGKIVGGSTDRSANQIHYEARIGGVDVQLIKLVYADLMKLLEGTDATVTQREENSIAMRLFQYVTPKQRGEVAVTQTEMPFDQGTNWRLEIQISEWPKGLAAPDTVFVRFMQDDNGWTIRLDGEPMSQDELIARLKALAVRNSGLQAWLDGDIVPVPKDVQQVIDAITAAVIPERNVKFAPWVWKRMLDEARKRGEQMKERNQETAKRTTPLPESVRPQSRQDELKHIGQLDGHAAMVTSLAWHPDGKRAVSIGHHDGEVRMWDVAGGKTLWTARVEAEQDESKRYANSAVAVSPDGLVVAVGSEPGVIYLLDSETGQEQRKWPSGVLHGGIRRGIDALEFAPSGDWLAVVGAAGSPASVWDLKTGTQIPVSDKASNANDVAFNADGKYLLTGGISFSERRITTDGQGMKALDQYASTSPEPEVMVFSVATSPDGKLAAYATSHGAIHLRRSNANGSFFPSNENNARADHPGVYSVTFTPDGRHLISAGVPAPSISMPGVQPQSSPTLIVWDIATMKPVFEHAQDSFYRIALSPDGRTLLTTGEEKLIHIWQLPESVWPSTDNDVERQPQDSAFLNYFRSGGWQSWYRPAVEAARLDGAMAHSGVSARGSALRGKVADTLEFSYTFRGARESVGELLNQLKRQFATVAKARGAVIDSASEKWETDENQSHTGFSFDYYAIEENRYRKDGSVRLFFDSPKPSESDPTVIKGYIYLVVSESARDPSQEDRPATGTEISASP